MKHVIGKAYPGEDDIGWIPSGTHDGERVDVNVRRLNIGTGGQDDAEILSASATDMFADLEPLRPAIRAIIDGQVEVATFESVEQIA